MKLPNLSQILQLHRDSIDEFGGEEGLLKPDELEGFVYGIPQAIYFGNKTIIETAAYLYVRFVQNHFFIDGNKRVGYGILLSFLELNHCRLINDIDFYNLTIRIASSDIDELEYVTYILKTNINCD